ncbi:hypothetical protein [Methylorubrum extorquens]|uniref:Lipoprotein n=1 Tax=Methylorubrum extorquens DSM 13060 TaxID=882800 RepID=H1KCF3_METEX|nr:hypothetical protein [Methylorubrum extorquens]EHP94777.1 hypothetical protein MetexDRAFT_0315 [Methylorubrum extorquens DSM 13060]
MSRLSRTMIPLALALSACATAVSARDQGPATGAVDAWFRNAKQPLCVSPDGNDVRCTKRNDPHYAIGYAPGGDAAIAVVRFQADPTGNAENLAVATFRSEGGRWTFVRKVENVFGQGPDRIAFEGRKAVFTMRVLRDGDGRCCPTGTKRYAVQVP